MLSPVKRKKKLWVISKGVTSGHKTARDLEIDLANAKNSLSHQFTLKRDYLLKKTIQPKDSFNCAFSKDLQVRENSLPQYKTLFFLSFRLIYLYLSLRQKILFILKFLIKIEYY